MYGVHTNTRRVHPYLQIYLTPPRPRSTRTGYHMITTSSRPNQTGGEHKTMGACASGGGHSGFTHFVRSAMQSYPGLPDGFSPLWVHRRAGESTGRSAACIGCFRVGALGAGLGRRQYRTVTGPGQIERKYLGDLGRR